MMELVRAMQQAVAAAYLIAQLSVHHELSSAGGLDDRISVLLEKLSYRA